MRTVPLRTLKKSFDSVGLMDPIRPVGIDLRPKPAEDFPSAGTSTALSSALHSSTHRSSHEEAGSLPIDDGSDWCCDSARLRALIA
jgi:hypothetical protein